MPLSPLHSAEWLQQIAVPPIKAEPRKEGRLYIKSASLVLTGAGQGTAKMMKLPPGKLRIWAYLSRLGCPIGAASSVISIGFPAYVKEDGTTQAANAVALASAVSTTSLVAQALPLPAIGYLDVDSQEGIDVEALFAGGNTAAAGEVVVAIAYTRTG